MYEYDGAVTEEDVANYVTSTWKGTTWTPVPAPDSLTYVYLFP